MKKNLAAFFCGLLFAVGLGISGMTSPVKVIGFLDFKGAWDASLLMVMAGAVSVYAIGYRLVMKLCKHPWCEKQFVLPSQEKLTPSLLIGAAIFGVGWGMSGFCPGPALVAIFSGAMAPVIFVLSMILGVMVFRFAEKTVR